MARDPVLGWAGLTKEAEERYGVPAAVLLGLIKVESGGDANAVSPAGAFGGTQFMPGTAPGYGVRRGDSLEARRSQVMGAARYLIEAGFRDDPRLALRKYNAGPNAPENAGDYDSKVLAAAKQYGGDGAAMRALERAARFAGGAVPNINAPDEGGLFDGIGDLALKALLWTVFVIGGMAMLAIGTARLTGVRNPLAGAAKAAGATA